MLAASAGVALGCQESGFDEGRETAQPLKVQHVLGESKVPGQAERPATLALDSLDGTLALGLKPVAAATPLAELPAYLRGRAEGVEPMAPIDRLGLHALRATDPDVILGSSPMQDDLYHDLFRIAPTVMTDGGGAQWKLNVRLVGEALGRTNDAEALLTDYDRRVAEVRSVVEGAPRVAVARMTADGLRLALRDSFAGTLLADVGARQVERPGRARRADVVLLSAPPDRRLRGNAERVDGVVWWGPGGMLAARAALADLKRALSGARG
jgi:ABC-type Fe3+-hydroxamate transport system substrate-binding protein